MKKLVILTVAALVCVIGGTKAFAQEKYGSTPEQQVECMRYLDYYQSYFKQNDYESALPNWRKAFNVCPPTASQNMFLNGATLYRQLIVKEKDEKYRGELIDTLLLIHDVRAESFPNYAATAINNKGVDVITFVKDNDEFVSEQLAKVIETNGVEVSPTLLRAYMDATLNLYKAGVLSADDVFEKYQGITGLLEEIETVKHDASVAENMAAVQQAFGNSGVADCDKLIELFTPQLAESSDSYDTAESIARRLQNAGCSDSDLYVAAVTQMHKLMPRSGTASILAKIYKGRGELEMSTTYMLQAIELEEDNNQKADYYFELAQTVVAGNGSNVKAVEYALKAVQLDTNNSVTGKAYMLCGTVWGASACKGNEIETRAPYWVAVDYMEKAKRADSSLAESCNRSIAQYSKFFPAAEDAFMYDLQDGQTYTVSCGGMTATTTVRTQK